MFYYFIVFLIFKYLEHWKFIFMYDVMDESSFIFLHLLNPFSHWTDSLHSHRWDSFWKHSSIPVCRALQEPGNLVFVADALALTGWYRGENLNFFLVCFLFYQCHPGGLWESVGCIFFPTNMAAMVVLLFKKESREKGRGRDRCLSHLLPRISSAYWIILSFHKERMLLFIWELFCKFLL